MMPRNRIDEKKGDLVKKCSCHDCARNYADEAALYERNYSIAQALLATGLYKDLINLLYDYTKVSLYPKKRWSFKSTRSTLSVECRGSKISNVCRRIFILSPDIKKPESVEIRHILPPEICFDAASFLQGERILYNKNNTINKLFVWSECKRYCLGFSYQKLSTSTCAFRLSETTSWQDVLVNVS